MTRYSILRGTTTTILLEMRNDYMALFKHHEPCPRCGSRDNLARYSDGSAFCFGCRYSERSEGGGFVRDTKQESESSETMQTIALPEDSGASYPECVITYLNQYNISVAEVLGLGVVWSPSRQQLIYPYYATDDNGKRYLACTQARNFNQQSKTKYTNKGKTTDVLPIIVSSPRTSRLVITEDALSALRIARQCDAMPALGTNVPVNKLNRLARLYSRLTVWLDSDKWREARHIADNFKWLGLSADTIYSELDPKCYSDLEIREFLK